MKKIIIFISVLTLSFQLQANYQSNQLSYNFEEVVIGNGTYTYEVYFDGMLVCWVKADSFRTADAWAKATYGPTAYVVLLNSFTPSLPGDNGSL